MAVKDFSLSLDTGELFRLHGPSGRGASTTSLELDRARTELKGQ